ncbi:6-O-methylguanine DNA methyltransferase [Boletus edulis BED1]|uniref:Methylated-DNA--protein-cysteine methyltransferase n=1 Tax=Boletus edulis BED1 TaxID=1328754 RepID=A0AAD4G8E3_BOLED|nr:6-O-methylguanine DNA methyltransferase [Boletus edulis BED1]
MPAITTKSDSSTLIVSESSTHKGSKRVRAERNGIVTAPVNDLHDSAPSSACTVEYPLNEPARATFLTRYGRKVTEHQWAVYDFARTIPCGRVTTYGALCKALGKGSPRSVGSALRHNPFAPFVPCHRVIASNLYIGGFFGEWGTLSSRKGGASGQKCRRKIEMLAMEGVEFTPDGYLADENLIWRG